MNDSSKIISLKEKLAGSNLYLIGMMGSGKSHTGPHLADKLGYNFVDIDSLIEEFYQKSIAKIFEEDGEFAFRKLESEFLKEIGKRHSLIVATGGGLIIKKENWGILHQGVVVWIDPGRDRLLKRLQSDKTIRPLLQKTDPIKTFDTLLAERNSIYAQSDLHVKVEEESSLEVASLIVDMLTNLINNQDGLI